MHFIRKRIALTMSVNFPPVHCCLEQVSACACCSASHSTTSRISIIRQATVTKRHVSSVDSSYTQTLPEQPTYIFRTILTEL